MTFMLPQGEFIRQAQVARKLGSPFIAEILEAGQRQLALAPLTTTLIETWPTDQSASALAMRFNAALHALARRGSRPALSALYRRQHDDYDGAIGAALAAEDAFVAGWMRDIPEPDDVGRAGAIAAALMIVRQEFRMPFELLEIGSSCGLNLNLAHYGYDLGGVRAGTVGSTVEIAPAWSGPPLEFAPIEVVSARGNDLNPLAADEEATRDSLLAYVWADQPQRARRLELALALARSHPPRIDRGDAATWLTARLATPQPVGACRVVFHSMVLQYLTPATRATLSETIKRAGAAACHDRPLAWIGFEWTPEHDEVQLRLTCWPGSGAHVLATCHANGDWIDWRKPRRGPGPE